MNLFTSFFKLLSIFREIFYHIWQSIVFNNLNSNNFLTSIFLKHIQRASQISSYSLCFTKDFNVSLKSAILNDSNKKMSERFILLTKEELFILSGLIHVFHPSTVFEFGVMRGGSLSLFLDNTSEHCQINSIDITHNNLAINLIEEIKNNSRINAIIADSTTYDFSPFLNSIDLIFIDGGHDYDIVKSDSENAFKMLNENGLIIWDDYNPEFPGVYKVINELDALGVKLIHIVDTSFVVFTNRNISEYVTYASV